MKNKISVIIPTYNRSDALEKCIYSIAEQKILPSEVVVIDDGSLDADNIERLQKALEGSKTSFVYYKKDHTKERKGLSESKNKALTIAHNNVVCFLDDDVVLEKDFFASLQKAWGREYDDTIYGIGGIIVNSRKRTGLEKTFHLLFGLGGSCTWDINDVGFQVWDDGIEKPEEGYYMHGGVSSYKKSIVQQLGGFEVFKGGRTGLEDVELSARAKQKGYKVIIDPSIRCAHFPSAQTREGAYVSGKKETANRKTIYARYGKKGIMGRIHFVVAMMGWITRQFLVGHIVKGVGMMVGLYARV